MKNKRIKHKYGLTLVVALITMGLCFTAQKAFAGNYDVGVSYMKTHQKLFDKIHFPMDTGLITVSYWLDESDYGRLGLRGVVGKSIETIDTYATPELMYSNKIDLFTSAEIVYKYTFTKTSIILGVGKTDYKSTWWVNGNIPSWGKGTDSDWSYTGGIGYKIEDNLTLELLYKDIYRKNKKGFGREETRGFSIGLVYQF